MMVRGGYHVAAGTSNNAVVHSDWTELLERQQRRVDGLSAPFLELNCIPTLNPTQHAPHLAQGVWEDAVSVHGDADGHVALGLRHRLQDVTVCVLLHQKGGALVQQHRQDQLRGNTGRGFTLLVKFCTAM